MDLIQSCQNLKSFDVKNNLDPDRAFIFISLYLSISSPQKKRKNQQTTKWACNILGETFI